MAAGDSARLDCRCPSRAVQSAPVFGIAGLWAAASATHGGGAVKSSDVARNSKRSIDSCEHGIDLDFRIGPMEETGNQDSETVRRQSVSASDKDGEIRESNGNHHSVRETVSCRRNSDGKLSSATSQRQAIVSSARHGHISARSPSVSSSGLLDEVAARSGTPEEQPDRLRPAGMPAEPVTDNGEEDVTRWDAAASQPGLRTVRSPSGGPLNPQYGPQTVTKGPPQDSNFRSEGTVNVRSTKSPPPSPGPTARITAFSVADILDPGKFGCDRRERVADSRLSEPRDPRSAAAAHQELWTPWMRRLELHLRAGATGIGNINFLRGIGQ